MSSTIHIPSVSRRRFLAGSAAVGATAVAAPRLAFATPNDPTAGDVIVLLFLSGGIDGLSVVVPYTDSEYYSIRPNIAIDPPSAGGANAALDIDGSYGFNPAMAPLVNGAWADGNMAVVHACGMLDNGNRSHFEATRYWEGGGSDAPAASGFLGRYLNHINATGLVPAVSRDDSLYYALWGFPGAMAIDDIDGFGLDTFPGSIRDDVRVALEAYYPGSAGNTYDSEAAKTLGVYRDVEAADPTAIPIEGTYPDSYRRWDFIETAQLIKADLDVRAVRMNYGGWDTHSDMGNGAAGNFRDRLADLSANIQAFYEDLNTRMNEVTLIVMSEFGRTIHENGDLGTDHGRGNVMMVIGNNVNGGLYGVSDFPGVVDDPTYGDLGVRTDYRNVVSEILRKRTDESLDLAAVFPTYAHTQGDEHGLIS